ncbi:RNA polymerase II elongation factor ELL2 isoform X2 [Bradysia coprophila]|uniref:RNA polymerase II elongation factor ELL2 isoform X2 n=1 Tax=Bradysia coprophila TaxID=38358 RepID=UPI00187D6FF9|nr:RNA polymerase II elongation factor ELL2 isoform X2 [Bradysia coprophila]
MAALCPNICPGISYGLSQSNISNANKEVIFVKLTDSAYRAIEDYQKNQNKLSSQATIQFLGNEGYLSFPSLSNNGGQQFMFSITETDEIQGSFDCIQQNHNQLDVVGALTNKLRIHANEDTYEATRHRMAVVEETKKNNCTREIKPNQTDIGRKVKVKSSINRLSNIPSSSTLNKRDSSSASNSLNNNVNNSATITQSLKNNNVTHNTQQQQQQQQNGLTTSAPLQSSNPLIASSIISATTNSNVHNSQNTNGLPMSLSASSGSVPRRVTNNRNQNSNSRGTPDIMKRPIRERLIHLLALRPYKKPELWARITSDGIREKERSLISTCLKSISILRENTYYLSRHIWNDVQEDWPFYTEQDRQTLKRRKPQNLTPPLSSDGGSGQSPSSTHNGSPPPAVKRPSLNNDKHFPDSGPSSKKQRISHFKKDVVDSNRSDYNSCVQLQCDNLKLLNRRRNVLDSRDAANLNPRSREYDGIPMRSSSHYSSSVTPTAVESDDNVSSLNFTVLNSEAAKRISSGSSSISDQEKDTYEETTKLIRKQAYNKPMNESTTYDFSQYSKITSIEQRRQYKKDFEKDFLEYKTLFENRQRITKLFTDLESQLRQVSNNEERHKDIQRKIIAEFQRTISDSSKQQQEERFQYLHQKLSRIKDIIHAYDESLLINGTDEIDDY